MSFPLLNCCTLRKQNIRNYFNSKWIQSNSIYATTLILHSSIHSLIRTSLFTDGRWCSSLSFKNTKKTFIKAIWIIIKMIYFNAAQIHTHTRFFHLLLVVGVFFKFVRLSHSLHHKLILLWLMIYFTHTHSHLNTHRMKILRSVFVKQFLLTLTRNNCNKNGKLDPFKFFQPTKVKTNVMVIEGSSNCWKTNDLKIHLDVIPQSFTCVSGKSTSFDLK